MYSVVEINVTRDIIKQAFLADADAGSLEAASFIHDAGGRSY